MAAIRKYGPGIGVLTVLLTLGGSLWWFTGEHDRAQALIVAVQQPASPDYEALTELQNTGVKRVLKEISLDRDALIALNLSSNSAESVLAAVRTWSMSNAQTMATLKAAVDEHVVAVYRAEKVVAYGPASDTNDATLASAREDLVEAKAAYRNAFASLKTSVSNLLTEGQRATWTAIQSGHGQTMPIRMLDLNDDQRMAIGKAWRRYQLQHAAATDDAGRSAAIEAWDTARNSILTTEQKNAMTAYYGYYASASQAIAGSLAVVFPPEAS